MAGLLGYGVAQVTSWWAVRRRLPAVRVRIVAVDETWLRVRGKSRSVGVVVGRDGRILGLELTGPGFDYGQWFQELADQLGVEVVVTDDAREYAGPIDDAGLGRQQCMALVRRTLGRWQVRLKPALPRKLLRLAVHLPERWRQMTLYQREPGVPNSANWLEGQFGRIKPRYRLTWGLKSTAGTANFRAGF